MAKRQFTKGIDLYRRQMKRLEIMQATMQQSVRMMRKLAEQDAKELTSGTLTPKQTRGQFARGRTPKTSTPTGRLRGMAPLLPINQVTKRLHRGIRSRDYRRGGFEIVIQGVPHAQYILSLSGTRKMVARGMKQEATRRLKARQKAHVDYFVQRQRNI